MEQDAQVVRENLEEQRQKALIDPLTGLPNRAAWSERLEHEVAQWQQHGNSLLLAMLDLDHFKRINDNYGHLAGDRVLKLIASVLRKRLRGGDFIARFGGEEFVLLVPNTPLVAGAKLAEALRLAIEACPFHFKGEPVTVTVSIGLTAFKPGEHSDLVLKRADQALYRAKKFRAQPCGIGLRANCSNLFNIAARTGSSRGNTLHCCITPSAYCLPP
nr:hypothetical protein GCM10020185_32360 [Pseudomonas brassicacearum subsp. brassicacearum]